MFNLFGWELQRKAIPDAMPSFVPKETDDGAVVVAAGGAYGTYIDLDGTVRTEAELVTKYREMALQPEVDAAIDEIVNESFSIDEPDIVNINLDNMDVSATIKNAIRAEFQNVLNILNFQNNAYDLYRRWYIDGRLYYHVIIDDKDTKAGIKEVRYVDPRKIRKIREVAKKRVAGGDGGEAMVPRVVNEYYIFNEKGFNFGNRAVGPSTTGLRIAKDAVVHITSGLTDTNGTMVLSYMHKAIKPLNQLRTMEDSLVIYRIARAPERRIWYIDVGNLPKMKAEQYVRDLMTKHKNRLIYDGSTGEVRDDRKFMCYTLDTKIPLLDGRTLTIEDIIAEYSAGKTNWVYSCDPVTGKFVPGPISWAGITKHNSDVVCVTFDNGKSVVCTPDHKFPVWNKGFIEAKDLAVGESLIPGYRRNVPIKDGDNEYEQIFKNDTQTWEFTHREVSKWKDQNNVGDEFTFLDQYADSKKNTVHHKDCNRFNNSPDNLVKMHYKDHFEYHGQFLAQDPTIQTLSYPQSAVDFVINNTQNDTNISDVLHVMNSDVRLLDEFRTLNSSKKIRKKISDSRKGTTFSAKTWKITSPNGEQAIVENLSKWCREHPQRLNHINIKGCSGSRGYKAEQLRNHKVVSVELLAEKMTVAALTIDQEETYHSHHTYLLDAGVYTKNTMLEDYWLPRREGGRGTEVTTLPGGQTLGELDDVLYFQKKLYQTLNVPINRLNSETPFTLGRATEITRDEIKFSKFITRLRGRFGKLFTSLLERQVVLKQIMSIEDWTNISQDIKYDFSHDSYFRELKDAEVLTNRVTLMSNMVSTQMIGQYYSHKWARKNVLMQSEEEIEELDAQIAQEQVDPRWAMTQETDENGNPVTDPNAGGDQGSPPPPTRSSSPTKKEEKGDPESQARRNKLAKVHQAEATVHLLKYKKDRSMQEEAKYRSAVQLLARNKK